MRRFVVVLAVVALGLSAITVATAHAQDPAAPGTAVSQVFNGGAASTAPSGCTRTEVDLDFRRTVSHPGGVVGPSGYLTVEKWDWCAGTFLLAQGEVTGFALDIANDASSAHVVWTGVLPQYVYGLPSGEAAIQLDVSFTPTDVSSFGQNPKLGGPVHIATATGGLSGSFYVDGTNFLTTDGTDVWNHATVDSWLYVN